jgi:hypothetical protein
MLQARVLQRNGTGEATLAVPLTVEHIEQDASSVPSLNATAGLEACTDPQAVPTPLIVHGDYYEASEASNLALVGFSVASFLAGVLVGAGALVTIAFCAYTGIVRTAVCGKDIENFDRGGVTVAIPAATPPKSISARLST